jgi:hypothetical protein
VTMMDAKRPDTKAEVILGVDTHLDVHVAVAVDHLGRRLERFSRWLIGQPVTTV